MSRWLFRVHVLVGSATGVANQAIGRLFTRWKVQLSSEGTNAFPGKGRLTPEKEELQRLRKDNQRLKMERDILKKAAAFFANESK